MKKMFGTVKGALRIIALFPTIYIVLLMITPLPRFMKALDLMERKGWFPEYTATFKYGLKQFNLIK